MFSALDLAISGIATLRWKKKTQNGIGLQPIPEHNRGNSSKSATTERTSSISKGKRTSSMHNIRGTDTDNRSSYGPPRQTLGKDPSQTDEDFQSGRESRKSTRSSKDKNRASIHHVIQDVAEVRSSQRSAKNARKYKSVELLRSSSESSVNEGRQPIAASRQSLRQTAEDKKLAQKQVFMELKRKQDRERLGHHHTASSQEWDEFGNPVKQAPVLPPKPKKYTADAYEGFDGKPPRRDEQINSSMRSTRSKGKGVSSDIAGRGPVPRSKLEKHNELLKEYFSKEPVDESIRTGLTDDDLDRAANAHPQAASSSYEQFNQASSRSVDRRRPKERRRSGTTRSQR